VLLEAEAHNWQHALYLPLEAVWDEGTPCAVLDPEAGQGPEGTPAYAKENRLQYAVTIATLQDIVTNARLQRPDANVDDLTKAFLFYYDHDAFIVCPPFRKGVRIRLAYQRKHPIRL
jgi:hypothetical protein